MCIIISTIPFSVWLKFASIAQQKVCREYSRTEIELETKLKRNNGICKPVKRIFIRRKTRS